MGIAKVKFDVDKMVGTINQVGDKAVKDGSRIMYDEGFKIIMLAGEFAPRDTGTLENTIKSLDLIKERDGMGRIGITIQFNKSLRNPDGTLVSEYGPKMEKYLEPESSRYRLGERSQQKAEEGLGNSLKGVGATGSGKVGGGFLKRAFRSRAGMIGKKLAERMRKLLK